MMLGASSARLTRRVCEPVKIAWLSTWCAVAGTHRKCRRMAGGIARYEALIAVLETRALLR